MSYQHLHAEAQKLGELHNALALLSWDEAVMMPAGSGGARGETLATLSGMAHDMQSNPRTREWIEATRDEQLSDWQSANVREMERAWIRANALPRDLVVALAKATSACEQAWRGARGANDYAAIVDKLREVTNLTRQRADALASALNLSPYDALLDEYEPGLTGADITPIFDDLAAFLPDFATQAIDRQETILKPEGPFLEDRQAALGKQLMRAIGFDFERGRLDISHHPFCGGIPADTRITTRFNTGDFLESMFAVLHETGHALYQQGLPQDWHGQPVGDSGGMALHESQSLLMEMQVCRGDAFLSFATPILQNAFLSAETTDPAWQAGNLQRMARRVERGFIRVDADEVTYPLHVILRHQLESELLSGNLEVGDLPEAWDASMRKYLGLSTLGNDADGCMQDVHWYAGLIGYFPTYTLGAVIAAQLFRTAREQLPDIDERIGQGDFTPLVAWLRQHVHGHGRRFTTGELVRRITGEELKTEAFREHLKARYL